ncbi:MAG TPA: ArsA-related P-loop ATPase [Thermoanaerobaculia bacterium]|jgi:anion-transporting  ArsA/GET3 family ATPase|nr:ArsA-related P-loop ATPase [Thermoanaerobaculia bacterium]
MELISAAHPLLIFVGSGGVGKTTLAAATGVLSARAGRDTLVMTFDPSLRLKQALGVGEAAREHEVPVDLGLFGPAGRLDASLLDAQRTFDRLIERYAPDPESRRRILGNRFYNQLSGSLGGILEYMAVERLFEVVADDRYDQVVLDTPPTRQALDFLEAPARIVSFLDSGALRMGMKPWFDEEGRLKAAKGWGGFGRRAERFLDDVVGLDLLRDMAEFFQAFAPLYAGFHERAEAVEALLRSPKTLFVLVSGPGEERIPDTLFFARRLKAAGYHLGPIVVNRVHPPFSNPGDGAPALDPAEPWRVDGRRLLAWLGERDRRGLAQLAGLLSEQPLVALPLLPEEPTDLPALARLGEDLAGRLQGQ